MTDISVHSDDLAIDRFAAAMKEKMAAARAKGRSGWDDPAQCSVERLQTMLLDHLEKNDPVDVGNFAMMLFNRSANVAPFPHDCMPEDWQSIEDSYGKDTGGIECQVCGTVRVDDRLENLDD